MNALYRMTVPNCIGVRHIGIGLPHVKSRSSESIPMGA